MRKDDSVFFFTLIDFLVTCLFFGLVLYAMAGEASAAALGKEKDSERMIARIRKASGVSDLMELTDRLTRLGPVREVERSIETVRRVGGADQVTKIDSLVRAAGGIDSLLTALTKMHQQEGFGKPPCRYTVDADGRKEPVKIAGVRATDSTITLMYRTPVFDSIVSKYGIVVPDNGAFTLREFRRSFESLPEREPNCRYSIEFNEQTRFVDARDAAGAGLRLSFVRTR